MCKLPFYESQINEAFYVLPRTFDVLFSSWPFRCKISIQKPTMILGYTSSYLINASVYIPIDNVRLLKVKSLSKHMVILVYTSGYLGLTILWKSSPKLDNAVTGVLEMFLV